MAAIENIVGTLSQLAEVSHRHPDIVFSQLDNGNFTQAPCQFWPTIFSERNVTVLYCPALFTTVILLLLVHYIHYLDGCTQ